MGKGSPKTKTQSTSRYPNLNNLFGNKPAQETRPIGNRNGYKKLELRDDRDSDGRSECLLLFSFQANEIFVEQYCANLEYVI